MKSETLFIVMVDVEPASAEDAFNAWYNDEHVPELLRVPGFRAGRRFRALNGTPKYAAMYELVDISALDEPLFHQARPAHPKSTPATKKMWPHVRNLRRGIYRQFLTAQTAKGCDPASARFLLLVGLDLAPAMEDQFGDWYLKQHVPALNKTDAVLQARAYVLDQGSTDHKDAPGRCLLLYDLARAEAGQSSWLAAPAMPWGENLTNSRHAGPRILYERIYPV